MSHARSMLALLLLFNASDIFGQFRITANPDGFADYSVQSAYQNLGYYFRPYDNGDSRGYPLAAASTLTYANGYPDGDYIVNYDDLGATTLSFSMGSETTYSATRIGNHVSGILKLRHDTPSGGGILTMSNSAAFTNLSIIRPDRSVNSDALFGDKWLRATAPWQGFRFMDWQQTNGSNLVSWNDRAMVNDMLRTTAKGVPVEDMIHLSNVHGVGGWFNIPHLADLSWVRGEANLVKQQLNNGLTADMEYSNELWNFAFSQAADNLALAKSSNRYDKPDDYGRAAQRAADKAGEYYKEWKAILGGKAGRLKLGGFIANQYWNDTALTFLKDHYPELMSDVDIVVAPYVPGNIGDIGGEKLTAEDYVNSSRQFMNDSIAKWLAETKATADRFGVGADTYEVSVLGGLTGINNYNLKLAAQRIEGAGQLTQEAIDLVRNNGFRTFNQFGIVTPWSEHGFWGPTDSVDRLDGPRWDALTPEPSGWLLLVLLMLRRRSCVGNHQ